MNMCTYAQVQVGMLVLLLVGTTLNLKAYTGPPINPGQLGPVDQAPLVAWSVRLQRDGSGTTGALRRLRQSRHDLQPLRRLTLNSHHRLFIQRPRCLTSMPGPALTGRHA